VGYFVTFSVSRLYTGSKHKGFGRRRSWPSRDTSPEFGHTEKVKIFSQRVACVPAVEYTSGALLPRQPAVILVDTYVVPEQTVFPPL
jgi:hypothetical protein